MTEKLLPKDPEAVLDYAFDWVGLGWLESGESISNYTVTVPTGLVKDSDSEAGGTVVFWLSGGTTGISYTVTCKITTSMGRTERRSMLIRCGER